MFKTPGASSATLLRPEHARRELGRDGRGTAKFLDDAVTRWDVNFVLGELIAELNASHTYRGGGDEEQAREARRRAAGRGLGAGRRRLPHQAHRRAAGPGTPMSLPAGRARAGVKEGDYVLAVNGVPHRPAKDPWAAFQGLADTTVTLTVNAKPTLTARARCW